MTRSTFRTVLTILMYVGVAIALFPYFSGKIFTGMMFLVGGIATALFCGLLRCSLTEGDCLERTISRPHP